MNPWFGAVKEPETFATCLSVNKKLSKTISIKYVSENFTALQPRGSDVIRQSGAGGSAVI